MEKEFADSQQHHNENLFSIGIEGEIRNKLEIIITWSKITSIGGFVNLGLSLLSSFLVFSDAIYQDVTWVALSAIVTSVISFFLNLFLLRFSTHLKMSLHNESQEYFIAAVQQLKAYMRMVGILLMVTILLAMISYGFVFTIGRGLHG